jgi:molybdopterin-guanine dinucleotide biosynthesis protein A
MNNNITGIILAGGRSSRMDQDKAFILFSGRPLIEIVIEMTSTLFEHLMIVANEPNLYQKYGIKIQSDIIKDCGPLGGIYTGLFYSRNKYNFIVACDMPFLNQDLVQCMIEKIGDFDVIIPEHNGQLEPLCAIYSKDCITPIKNQLSQNNLKITDFFQSVKVKTILEEETIKLDPQGFSFTNINTPQDLKAALHNCLNT